MEENGSYRWPGNDPQPQKPKVKPDFKKLAGKAIATLLAMIVLFPIMGRALGMTDEAFGIWAGTAVNDTSCHIAVHSVINDKSVDRFVHLVLCQRKQTELISE